MESADGTLDFAKETMSVGWEVVDVTDETSNLVNGVNNETCKSLVTDSKVIVDVTCDSMG